MRGVIERIVDNFIRSAEFADWQSERVESGGYARPGSDARERFDRCYDAAKDGADGSTHREAIDDMREGFRAYLHDRCRRRNRANTRQYPREYPYRVESAAMEYFDQLETWHEKNGTLDQEIG